tara:strand:- start:1849 stop:1995 length:147 start_codon:yes stop_codon:yes gene_type:complete
VIGRALIAPDRRRNVEECDLSHEREAGLGHVFLRCCLRRLIDTKERRR